MLNKKRNGVIDMMRFVFCVLIVFWHSCNLGSPPDGVALFADAGYIAVEFFFLVAGFLMTKKVMTSEQIYDIGPQTILFLWNKIKTILPYYIFAVFCSYCRIIIVNDFNFKQTITNLMLGIWDFAFLKASGIKTYSLTRATWYLSAMYISMLILYPLLLKYRKSFTHIIAPVLSIFGLGYLSQRCGNLDQYVNNWNLVYPGIIRAVAEISLGCICFEVYEKIENIHFTKVGTAMVTFVQVAGYVGVLYCAHNMPVKQFDFVMLLALAVCVTLSFSGKGLAVGLFTGKIFPWLGKMSMIIYLNHMWVKDSVAAFLPASLGYWKLCLITFLGVFTASLVCLLVVNISSAFWQKYRLNIKNVFIEN